jgi:hypothetical protein
MGFNTVGNGRSLIVVGGGEMKKTSRRKNVFRDYRLIW